MSTQCPYANVYSSFTQNCQKPEAIKMSSHRWWINKSWYIHTVEYYSGININELSTHRKTWMNLRCLWLGERSQSEKTWFCRIPTPLCSRNGKIRDRPQVRGCQGSQGSGQRVARWSARIFREVKVFCMRPEEWLQDPMRLSQQAALCKWVVLIHANVKTYLGG